MADFLHIIPIVLAGVCFGCLILLFIWIIKRINDGVSEISQDEPFDFSSIGKDGRENVMAGYLGVNPIYLRREKVHALRGKRRTRLRERENEERADNVRNNINERLRNAGLDPDNLHIPQPPI